MVELKGNYVPGNERKERKENPSVNSTDNDLDIGRRVR